MNKETLPFTDGSVGEPLLDCPQTGTGDGLEVIASRVHNKWEAEVYDDLMAHKSEPEFYSRLCNKVAQLRYDRIHGEGRFASLTETERYKEYLLAGEYIDAVRDLGHLLN